MTTEIQEYSKTDAALADLRARHGNVVHDATTPEGMTVCRAGRKELRTYRTDLEKTRVAIKAPALERCRAIDTEAKRITTELWALEEPYDVAIKAVEEAEEREKQARIKADADRFNAAEAARKAAEQAVLDAERAELKRMRDEIEAQAEAARIQRDEADRVAREARDRLEQEARTAREAEEKRLRDERLKLEARQAEQSRIEQAEADRLAQIERDRLAAEAKTAREAQAKLDAEAALAAAAERNRLDDEAKAKREAEAKRAADAVALAKRQAEEAAAKRRADLKAKAPALRVAAIDAHALLCALGHVDDEITLTLGFAIEADAKPARSRRTA